MGTSAKMPKISSRILGGMSEPMVPAAATEPAARPLSYFAFSISGTAMRPIAAAQATEEPVTAENPAAPPTEAMARPPGNAESQ